MDEPGSSEAQRRQQEGASTSGRAPVANFGHVRTLQGHDRAIASVKFSPSGTQLASASADKTAKIWSVDGTGEPVVTLTGHSQGLSDVAWHPSGRYLATASDDHTVRLWAAGTGKCLNTLTGHTNFVFCCSFSPNGNLLVGWGCGRKQLSAGATLVAALSSLCASRLLIAQNDVYEVS
jgi:COMPASS component SWD3